MRPSSEVPTLWYGTADAPAPPDEVTPGAQVSLTVGVHPACFSNAINVYYSVDRGPERMLRAFVVRRDYRADTEYFRADFPFIVPGSCVRYQAKLVSIGRVIEAEEDPERPRSFCVRPEEHMGIVSEARTPSAGGARFGYRAEFLARAHIPVEMKPEVIGVTPEGLRVDFYVKGGTIMGPRMNAEFTHHGGDWMKIRPDGIGIADIRATLVTPAGERILAEYSGVLELGPDGYERAIEGIYPPNPPASVTPRFLTSSREYDWLNRLQCFGTGFLDTRAYVLNYDMYTIHPLLPKPAHE